MFLARDAFLDRAARIPAQDSSAIEASPATSKSQLFRCVGTHPKLENISVDYAILEPATRQAQQIRISVIPAEIGWSDIGSWAAVYELLAKQQGQNIFIGQGEALDAEGNLFFSPKKFVAAIGVRDLILVDTPDALLICPRDRAQDAGKIVKALEARKLKRLL
jgi:mannose-1-phosphate guanylyltransferase